MVQLDWGNRKTPHSHDAMSFGGLYEVAGAAVWPPSGQNDVRINCYHSKRSSVTVKFLMVDIRYFANYDDTVRFKRKWQITKQFFLKSACTNAP